MDDLNGRIQRAQVHAGEQEVLCHLAEIEGRAPLIEQPTDEMVAAGAKVLLSINAAPDEAVRLIWLAMSAAQNIEAGK